MGQWTTQFGGAMHLGVIPPDFVSVFDEYDIEPPAQVVSSVGNNVGAYVLRAEDNSGTEHLLRWIRPDTHDDLTDTDQLCLVQATETPVVNWAGLWARAGGADLTEEGYFLQLGESGGGSEMQLLEFTAGTPSTLVDVDPLGTPSSFVIDTWYWLQFRVEGDSLKARCWEFGTDVPLVWQIDTTDSTHTAAGWIGLGSRATIEIEFDYYSVGTQGDVPEYPLPVAVNPGNSNVLVAIPDQVQTDGTVFLVYTGEPNVAVDWNLTGDGTLTVLTDQTDAAGKATARYTAGTVGAHNVDVTVGV